MEDLKYYEQANNYLHSENCKLFEELRVVKARLAEAEGQRDRLNIELKHTREQVKFNETLANVYKDIAERALAGKEIDLNKVWQVND